MTKFIGALIFAIIIILIDLYCFQAVKILFSHSSDLVKRIIFSLFWFITILTIGTFIIIRFIPGFSLSHSFWIYFIASLFIIYFSKIFLVLFLLVDDLVRLGRWVINKISNSNGSEGVQISRLDFINQIGVFVAAIPFITLIYGMVKGAFDYTIKRKTLKFSNLPKPFDGLKVIQISDIHTGSFVSRQPLKRAVEMVNSLKPDIVFFTGDLVNNKSDEAYPHLDTLKRIEARLGVFSILGNHDYGDYHNWPSKEAKKKNMEVMYQMHHDLGWKLLRNDNAIIEQGGEKLSIIGVENWSAKNYFPKYGDLAKAVNGINGIPFKILLSHDPTHWDAEVSKSYKDIDLTLSGHTHGMQFGVDIPGFKWSPVKYFYKHWAGLYKNDRQYLYVNRGLGFLGYPGRVGMTPEITVFELHKV